MVVRTEPGLITNVEVAFPGGMRIPPLKKVDGGWIPIPEPNPNKFVVNKDSLGYNVLMAVVEGAEYEVFGMAFASTRLGARIARITAALEKTAVKTVAKGAKGARNAIRRFRTPKREQMIKSGGYTEFSETKEEASILDKLEIFAETNQELAKVMRKVYNNAYEGYKHTPSSTFKEWKRKQENIQRAREAK